MPWMMPPRRLQPLKPGLYLVATPIGNLGDITLRALDTLCAAGLVVCEDTRVTGKLLSHYGIKKSLQVYNDHSDDKGRAKILDRLGQGKAIALVSDAGMPLISDPGYKLVRDCHELGLPVFTVPGANAALAGLQLSGLPSDSFAFLGFVPPKQGARQKILKGWANIPASLIVYEAPSRLLKTLQDIHSVLGDRVVAVTRELTKLYEEVRKDKVSSLIEFYTAEGPPKGEIVLVIEGAEDAVVTEEDLETALRENLKTMSLKDAAAALAQETGAPRKTIYDLGLKIQK